MNDNNRTINSSLFEKMSMQAEEADLLGFDKIASSLTLQLEKLSNKVRKDDEFYSYTKEELREDVENCLWDAAVRVADFYNIPPGEKETQERIEELAEEFIETMEQLMRVTDGVGAHEPNTPGEEKKIVVLEVSENE